MPAPPGKKPRPDQAEETPARPAVEGTALITPTPGPPDQLGQALHDAAPVFTPGLEVAGRYRIVRFIAAGGMGEVYEAEDVLLGTHVALKTIRPDIARRPRAMERFRREILLARKVTHPNVCRIFDVGHHAAEPQGSGPGVTFLTMELLRGETLDSRLRAEGLLLPEDALPLVEQMTAALAAAHQAGVVHRDFKAANVMLVPPRSGEAADRVVVTDFGLARPGDGSDEHPSITRSDHIVGTPAYMAPEQIEGGEVTPAADIYALGVVLYEMVTGRRPFEGDSPLSTVLKRFREEPTSPRDHVPGLEMRWEQVILRCLERDPRQRFGSAADVAAALRGETVPAARRRARARTALLAALAVGVLASVGYLAVRGRLPAREVPPVAALPPANTPARRSVAVLGFKNLSGKPENGWLSTALSEMLAAELAAGEKLRMVPGENVTRMKSDLHLSEAESLAPESLARIRTHVGADVIVLGSYLAIGGEGARRIRVDLRVQDTGAGETLAALTETGTEAEMFDLVSRTGERLRERLGVGTLTASAAGALRASRPSNPEAARLYAEGIEKLRSFDALAARPLLEKAAAADPEFAPAHAALAEAWSVLGYDSRAASAAREAFQRASAFSREERLAIEGRLREATKDWPRAVDVYRSLWTFFPDDLEHGLRLAAAQTSAGQAEEARKTIAVLRKLPPPASEDPRLDLAEAAAAETLSDFKAEKEAAARAATKASARGASLLLARARLAEAWALRHSGQPRQATVVGAETRRLYEAAGDRAGVASALLLLSNSLEDQGDLAGARRAAEDALVIRREIGDVNGMARTLNSLANVLDAQGDMAAARKTREESLALFRRAGNRHGTAIATFNLANLMAKGGDREGAKARYGEALVLFREVGNRLGIAAATTGLGNEMKERGEFAGAKRHYDEALVLNRETGDPVGQSICHANLGFLAGLLGDLGEAQKQYEAALRTARDAENKSLIAIALVGLGEVAARRGELAVARRKHEEALEVRTAIGEERNVAESRMFLAMLALEEGRPADAEAAARELPGAFARMKSPEYEAHARVLRARVLLETGKVAAAREELDRGAAVIGSAAPPELRFGLALASGRVRAASGDTAGALKALEATAAAARTAGLVGFELEARLAVGEIEVRSGRADAGRARLRELEADAREKGYGSVAQRAAAGARANTEVRR